MKITTNDFNPKIYTGATIYIDIDVITGRRVSNYFRFIKDEDLHTIEILMENQGEFEHLEEFDPDYSIIDHDDLITFATQWILKHVHLKND